ncbi:MAG: hypothetical protein ACLFT3_11970 [Cyclobacteriaceae bacterium]
MKAFRHELSVENLTKFRKNIADFFAEILMDEADKVWEDQAWNEEKLQQMLNTKMRTARNKREE